MLQNIWLTYPWEDHGFLSLAHIITLIILLCVGICDCICMTVWRSGLGNHAMNRETIISSPALCTTWASHFSLNPRNLLEGSAHTQKHTLQTYRSIHAHTYIDPDLLFYLCVYKYFVAKYCYHICPPSQNINEAY